MSDATASQTALDPDRPWITNEEDLPVRMSWFQTFLNPAGESPKLHFTRAWTVLFFAGLLSWVGLGMIISVVGIAGVDTGPLNAFHGYFIAVVLAITSLFSYVIHTRRLNHAGKISLRAIIVLVPLILAGVVFMGGVQAKATQYAELYEARAEFLEDPQAWRDARLEERREQQAGEEARRQAAEEARANGEEVEGEGQGQRRGNRGGPPGGGNQGPSAENPLPTKEAFIVRPNLGAFNMTIVGLNTLIMIWTLLWVARVPNFGKEPKNQAYSEQPQYRQAQVDGPFS